MKMKKVCPECHGRGKTFIKGKWFHGTGKTWLMEKCRECDGEGFVIIDIIERTNP